MKIECVDKILPVYISSASRNMKFLFYFTFDHREPTPRDYDIMTKGEVAVMDIPKSKKDCKVINVLILSPVYKKIAFSVAFTCRVFL